MAVVTATNRPKDTDNLNLRMPAGLRERVVHAASEGNVSQNAFITTSLLFSTLVWGELPPVGHPDNVVALLDEVDRAIRDNDAAIGAFDKSDWSDVEPFLKLLAMVDLVSDIKVRPDTKASDTVVFSFNLTRTGLSTWHLVRQGLEMAVGRLKQEAVDK
jgi:hypothetical protein